MQSSAMITTEKMLVSGISSATGPTTDAIEGHDLQDSQ